MSEFLRVQQLSYSYFGPTGKIPVIQNLSFSVKEGEFVAIIGPSGCGKTTLLSLLAGLLRPLEGSILLENTPLLESDTVIGYMLQKDHLLDWRTTRGNVRLSLEIRRECTASQEQRISQMLDDYGLSSFSESKPSELSGGMRQRVALIRTLVQNPKLLLLDEPFSALDAQTRLEVSEDVSKIIRNAGITTILITHDIPEAISMADRVLVLSPRPTGIRSEHVICPELATLSPFESRNTTMFQTYFQTLWKELML